jgi:hypothetical protein
MIIGVARASSWRWWPAGGEVVLFDEASRMLTAGVRRWAGIAVETHEVKELAARYTSGVDSTAAITAPQEMAVASAD